MKDLISEFRSGLAGRRAVVAAVLLLLLVSILTLGCSGSEEEGESAEVQKVNREYFAKWLKHRSQFFDIRYSPNEDLHSRMEALGQKVDEVLGFNAMILRTKPPDSLFLMIFENATEAQNLMGRTLPYYSNDTVYYHVAAPLGVAVAQLMLDRAATEEIRYQCVAEGYPTLVDFSGFNYHQMALDYLERGNSYAVSDLFLDANYEQMQTSIRKIQAASFLGYLTYTYGAAPLVALIKHHENVDQAMKATTGKTLDQLAGEWEANLTKLAALEGTEAQP